MIYTPKITSDIQINSLKDLVKLKPFLEDSTLKINKSQIARELGKDRRTVDKYLKGYEKPTARKRSSCIDDYYDIIKELLSDENQQIFYYKRVLWQFLKDNHGLSCASQVSADTSASIQNSSLILNEGRSDTSKRNLICALKHHLENKHSWTGKNP